MRRSGAAGGDPRGRYDRKTRGSTPLLRWAERATTRRCGRRVVQPTRKQGFLAPHHYAIRYAKVPDATCKGSVWSPRRPPPGPRPARTRRDPPRGLAGRASSGKEREASHAVCRQWTGAPDNPRSADTRSVREVCTDCPIRRQSAGRRGQRPALSAGIASERPTPNSRPSDFSRFSSTSSSAATNVSACSGVVMSGGRIFSTF